MFPDHSIRVVKYAGTYLLPAQDRRNVLIAEIEAHTTGNIILKRSNKKLPPEVKKRHQAESCHKYWLKHKAEIKIKRRPKLREYYLRKKSHYQAYRKQYFQDHKQAIYARIERKDPDRSYRRRKLLESYYRHRKERILKTHESRNKLRLTPKSEPLGLGYIQNKRLFKLLGLSHNTWLYLIKSK